jgi:electron transfer flavoprotein alpha subunit
VLLTLVEHQSGAPAETSLEALALGLDLAAETGSSLDAVVFGAEGGAVADDLGAYGVETVDDADDERLDAYAPEARGAVVADIVAERSPEAVVAPGTDRGNEVLAHVGADRDLPVVANCIDGEAGEAYEVTRHRWGGSLIEHARLDASTKLLTAAEHEYDPVEDADPTEPTVHSVDAELPESAFRVAVDRVEESEVEGVPLGEARVVVSGGRGVGGPDDYGDLEALADLLDGAVGASRAAINEGWRPHDDQIGLTGAKISPDLYVPCGISGAVQHMVGCKGADTVLAINTDPEAAIVQKCDYAVIGDLHEVVPALNGALREELE